jgi:regulator of sigma E protease
VSLLVALIVLSFLIFFHELGHFLAARAMGVRVEVFSIGFGRRILSRQIGETEYRLAMIPLGGYVRMKGQDDADPTKKSFDSDSYNVKTPLQKIFILFAGPFANFLLAFLCYLVVAWMGAMALSTTVGSVLPDSPAYQAGLLKDDKIVQVSGTPIQTWKELGEMIARAEGTIDLTVERQGQMLLLFLEPQFRESENIFGEKIQKRMIGVMAAGTVITVDYGFFEAFGVALNQTVEASTLIVKGVEKLITGAVSAENVGGVVSIVDYTAKASEAGLAALLLLSALMSVNFGVLNLLPIPALDGGHILFNLYEMITRKEPSEAVLYRLTIAGWMLLAGLMFLGLYNDINRLITG